MQRDFPVKIPDFPVVEVKDEKTGEVVTKTPMSAQSVIAEMDKQIGAVLNQLEDDALLENTIIFFLSDNGGAKASSSNNLPLRDFKHSVYEGGFRVPFILSWPGNLQHAVCDEPVMSIDIMPFIARIERFFIFYPLVFSDRSLQS